MSVCLVSIHTRACWWERPGKSWNLMFTAVQVPGFLTESPTFSVLLSLVLCACARSGDGCWLSPSSISVSTLLNLNQDGSMMMWRIKMSSRGRLFGRSSAPEVGHNRKKITSGGYFISFHYLPSYQWCWVERLIGPRSWYTHAHTHTHTSVFTDQHWCNAHA